MEQPNDNLLTVSQRIEIEKVVLSLKQSQLYQLERELSDELKASTNPDIYRLLQGGCY